MKGLIIPQTFCSTFANAELPNTELRGLLLLSLAHSWCAGCEDTKSSPGAVSRQPALDALSGLVSDNRNTNHKL